jgi:predicted phage baseplate assembly protein
VSAATPSTIASTLVVRVNGVEWTEVPFLYGHGPTEPVYVTRLDTNGNRYVEFGDGEQNGARLPTGQNNVVATYRQGLGSDGNVKAGQLSTLLSRPLGLHGAVNPLPASGGGDPQTLADARATAPVTVRALDRIVSLDDFGDFARASAAIAKAQAVWAWDGARRVVCITVSGPDGSPIVPETPAYANLLAAIVAAGDGTVPVRLCSYVPRTFTVGVTLTIDPAYDGDAVVAAAKDALHAAFAFDARDFMQPVYRSEVIALLQGVPGVVALTLDTLRYADALVTELLLFASDGLVAGPPRLVGGQLVGAELLTIDPGPLPGVVRAS